MRELSKRLAEVEYILKQMDICYIEKLPDSIVDYISENKDYEYSIELCNNNLLNIEELPVDTVAILTYINMNYFLELKEKEELNVLLKKTQLDIENRKKEKYKYDDMFPKNNNNINELNEENESKQLVEYKKQNWFKRLLAKLLGKVNYK